MEEIKKIETEIAETNKAIADLEMAKGSIEIISLLKMQSQILAKKKRALAFLLVSSMLG